MFDKQLLQSYKRVLSYAQGKRKKLSKKDLDRVLHLAEEFINLHDRLDYYTEGDV